MQEKKDEQSLEISLPLNDIIVADWAAGRPLHDYGSTSILLRLQFG